MSVDITLIEGEAFLFQWTIKEDGTVEDIGGWTLTLFARDDGAAAGTNRIDGESMTITGDGSGGIVTYTFTTTDTLITESTENITDVEGKYTIYGVNGAQKRYTDFGRFKIIKNPFIVTT
jgi:hypothetical protein